MRAGDSPLLQISPFILEIVGEKLEMRTGNVGQQDAGNQDRTGNGQRHQREDENDSSRLYR